MFKQFIVSSLVIVSAISAMEMEVSPTQEISNKTDIQTFDGFIRTTSTSPDNTVFVSGCIDGTVIAQDSSKLDKRYTGHTSGINSIAISSDNNYLATGSDDKTAKLWNRKTGECIHTLAGHEHYVMSVKISPDQSFVVTGSWDNTAKIWDFATGECLQTLSGHKNSITAVAVSKDSKYIVTASFDKTAKIWNIDTGECVLTLSGHNSHVVAVKIDNEDTIITTSYDSVEKIWNGKTGECINTRTLMC